MNATDCIKTRRSIRKFTGEQLPHAVIEEIVDLARMAPSWKNTQVPRYTLVEDQALIERIATEATAGFTWNEGIIKGAPALMVMSYVQKRCGYERDGSFSSVKGDQWQMFDCGVAAQTFCLAAHEKGAATVILGLFDEDKIKEMLSLPENETVACLIPIGYAAEEPAAPKRREVAEILSYR